MDIATAIMPTDAAKVEAFRTKLLNWYDKHRRTLPWRALPGVTPDPYHVWLSEIMLQQTTVTAVKPYFEKFLRRWPSVSDLAAAPAEDVMEQWAGLGYYTRARNLHKCAQVVTSELGGHFPGDLLALRKLPGIGDYTAAAVTAIAFNRPANVVDGNVERVMARIFAVEEEVPAAKPLLKSLAAVMAEGEAARPGDYAQSLMDLGATICTPTSPKCMLCPVSAHCEGYRKGIAATLPRRSAKPQKPQKQGYIYWIRDSERGVLFHRRPEKGMLAATLGLPTSDWVEKGVSIPHLPVDNAIERKNILIKHSFTHFDLELFGMEATSGYHHLATMEGYFWVKDRDVATLGLPSVFKKALKLFI